MSNDSPRRRTDSPVAFFVLTFAITWGIGAFAIFLPRQLEALFGKLTDSSPLYYVAVAAPTISATILAFARGGWPGLYELYARLVRWRFGLRWYALVLIGIPALGWLASWVTGLHPQKDAGTPAQFLWPLLYLLITGPLGEELGWRGFALPRLLKRFHPFAASLILGAIWGVWHLPTFFVGGTVQSGMSLPLFLLFCLSTSVLVTWLFQHAGGSVLITVLFHYMVNFTGTILGVPLSALGSVMLTAAILVIALDKKFGWFRKEQSWTLDPQLPPIKPASPTM
ncbi:MAG: CPBP family intramembrane glutamic endopeptidase [Bacteroidota bacterium]